MHGWWWGGGSWKGENPYHDEDENFSLRRMVRHMGSSSSFEFRLCNYLEFKMTIILNQQMMTRMRKRRRKTPGSSDWWPPPSTNGHKSSEMQRVMQIKPVGFLTDPSQPHFLSAAKMAPNFFCQDFSEPLCIDFKAVGGFSFSLDQCEVDHSVRHRLEA